MNKFFAIGRTGKDPELKEVNGQSVVSFNVATTERWKDKEGNRKESTDWITCEAWGGIAKVIGQWVKKGDLLYIEGKFKNQKYETKEGETKYRTFIRVTEVELMPKSTPKQTGEPIDELPF